MAFRLDRERGTLSPADPPWTQLAARRRPAPSGVSPARPFAYVIGELDSTVTVCVTMAAGRVDARYRPLSTLPADFTGQNLGAEIKVAPSGRFVYASNRGHDSLAIYAVDPETGQLSLVGHESTQGRRPARFRHRSNRRVAAGGQPGYGHGGHVLD